MRQSNSLLRKTISVQINHVAITGDHYAMAARLCEPLVGRALIHFDNNVSAVAQIDKRAQIVSDRNWPDEEFKVQSRQGGEAMNELHAVQKSGLPACGNGTTSKLK